MTKFLYVSAKTDSDDKSDQFVNLAEISSINVEGMTVYIMMKSNQAFTWILKNEHQREELLNTIKRDMKITP